MAGYFYGLAREKEKRFFAFATAILLLYHYGCVSAVGKGNILVVGEIMLEAAHRFSLSVGAENDLSIYH